VALQSMKFFLKKAMASKYAIGAFNSVDENTTCAIIQASQEMHSPVIVQTSMKTVTYYGAKVIASWVHALAAEVSVPVAFHLDHCREIDMLRECVDAGWTDVMFDGSNLPFNENIEKTHKAATIAHMQGVNIEGELGAIMGVEDGIKVDESCLTDPTRAEQFVRETEIDFFAPAIGTAHGVYWREPHISFSLLSEIAGRIHVPIVIHGGTGLSEELFKRCIKSGGVKINISTQLKHTFRNAYENYFHNNPEDYEPLKAIKTVYEEIKIVIKNYITIFGSNNKA